MDERMWLGCGWDVVGLWLLTSAVGIPPFDVPRWYLFGAFLSLPPGKTDADLCQFCCVAENFFRLMHPERERSDSCL